MAAVVCCRYTCGGPNCIVQASPMFFKRRNAEKPTGPATKQKRPQVHVTSAGVFWVDVRELFESEVGQESLREAEELAKRLGFDRPTADSKADTAPSSLKTPPLVNARD